MLMLINIDVRIKQVVGRPPNNVALDAIGHATIPTSTSRRFASRNSVSAQTYAGSSVKLRVSRELHEARRDGEIESRRLNREVNDFCLQTRKRRANTKIPGWRTQMTGHVTTELSGGILTLTLARADKKNALSDAMYSALSDGLEGAET